MFGEKLEKSIIEENKNDASKDMTGEKIKEKWDEIIKVIEEIPTFEKLSEKYAMLEIKKELSEIAVPEKKLDILLEYSPLVRNRLTLMRIRRLKKVR